MTAADLGVELQVFAESLGGVTISQSEIGVVLDALAYKAAMDIVNAPIVLARASDEADAVAERLRVWINELAAEIRKKWKEKAR